MLRPLLRGVSRKRADTTTAVRTEKFCKKKKKKINSWTVRAVRKIFGRGAVNRFEPRPNVTKQAPPHRVGPPPFRYGEGRRYFFGAVKKMACESF